MLAVRVLGLVDEDVVDAAVELVEHPVRVDARKKRQRLVDEILEIEHPEARLRAPHFQRDRLDQDEQGLRPRHRFGGLELVAEGDDAALLGENLLLHRGMDRLRADRAVLARNPSSVKKILK